jgi:hypothetical protein
VRFTVGFATGQVVRVNESAKVSEYMRGRLAKVEEVVDRKDGKTYMVSMGFALMPVKEHDLRLGDTEDIVQ